MQAEIDRQTQGVDPDTVQELLLDTSRATQVPGFDKFPNLQNISLNGVGLQSLDGFPKLLLLKQLELNDNWISNLKSLNNENVPALETLKLAGNKLNELSDLEPLKTLENLKHIELEGCALQDEIEDYPAAVFEFLPQLVSIDGLDRDGQEVDVEDDSDSGDEDDVADVADSAGDNEDDEGDGSDSDDEGSASGSSDSGSGDGSGDDDEGDDSSISSVESVSGDEDGGDDNASGSGSIDGSSDDESGSDDSQPGLAALVGDLKEEDSDDLEDFDPAGEPDEESDGEESDDSGRKRSASDHDDEPEAKKQAM